MFRFVCSLCLTATHLALVGCSGGPALAPVQGTVTLDGKPLAKGVMTFECVGMRPAFAKVENGQIVQAMTFKENDGVPVGSHKIGISATEDAASAVVENPGEAKGPGANYMGGKSLIPARYNNPSSSQLTAEIASGENNLKFELTSK